MLNIKKIISDKNELIAAKITAAVGTMACTYIFALISLTSLKANLSDIKSFVAWLSSQFLQLVLLPLIMVGTNYLNKKSEERAQQDHEALLEELSLVKQEVVELRTIERKLDLILGKMNNEVQETSKV